MQTVYIITESDWDSMSILGAYTSFDAALGAFWKKTRGGFEADGITAWCGGEIIHDETWRYNTTDDLLQNIVTNKTISRPKKD